MQSSSSGSQGFVGPMIYLTGALVGCLFLATMFPSIFLPLAGIFLVTDIVFLIRHLSSRSEGREAEESPPVEEPTPPEELEEDDLPLEDPQPEYAGEPEEPKKEKPQPVAARMEVGINCPRCESFLPLNGPVLKAHCRSCQSDIEIPESYWKDVIGDAMEDLRAMEKGTGTSSQIFGQFRSSNKYGRLDPYCLKCKTDFDDPWSLDPGMTYSCKECGTEYPVQAAPEWLSTMFPNIMYLLNAEREGEDAENVARDSPNPVVFTCPQCGGALKVTGEDRLVHCRYCDADVYLPDDLWLRLHPAKKKERWFLVYE